MKLRRVLNSNYFGMPNECKENFVHYFSLYKEKLTLVLLLFHFHQCELAFSALYSHFFSFIVNRDSLQLEKYSNTNSVP